jgi:L,D-peptidoglycan transpeptidase YkuD (ErfK/YbiS/YcfS/YnhG family)
VLHIGPQRPDNAAVSIFPRGTSRLVALVSALLLVGLLAPASALAGATARPSQPAYTAPDFATAVPATATQVVRTVRTNRWCSRVWCTVTQAWHKRGGRWRIVRLPSGERAVFRSSVGPKGFAAVGAKRQSDGRTPSGVFPIAVTFSTSATAPGAMPWRRRLPTSNVTNYKGLLYNTWIEESGRTDGTRPSMRWGFWVGYNHPRLQVGVGPQPVQGMGSGIFYHTSRAGYRWNPTEGCTNIGDPAQMRWVLTWLRPDADPRVVQHR